jgi:Leucine Rich repeat
MMVEANNRKLESCSYRRWLRFSLRSLLAATTVFCIWLGFKVNVAREQRQIVKMVQELGGTVWYDYEFDSAGNHLNPPPEAGWLANLLGVDFLHNVLAIRILNEDYQRPKNYSDLMSRLRHLPNLDHLVLTGGTVRDDDFQYLASLQWLEYVGLIQNEITGEGIRYLKDSGQLKRLLISSNPIGDVGLNAIAGVPNLQWLRLVSCGVSDSGLQRLKPIASLEKIELYGATITDACIDTVLSFPRLKEINLMQTAITPDGVKRLQQVRPALKIIYH